MDEIQVIQSKIYEIRGQRVMLDRDLAEMYGVETRVLNQAVKRNIERFPEDFMFQLTKGEFEIMKSQFVISNEPDNQHISVLTSQNVTSKIAERRGGTQKAPFAFTELGVAMLSSVLRSPLAIQVNMGIMRAFVALRHLVATLPNTTSDVTQLRKDFEELKLDIEDILRDQNEINEDTRLQLDAISTAVEYLCLASLLFHECLYLQTILIQQEVHQSHHQNALFIAPGFDVVFYNDNLLERVININQ